MLGVIIAVAKENMKVVKVTPLSPLTSSASCRTDVIPYVSSQGMCDGGTVTNADGIIFLLSWLVRTVAFLGDDVSSAHAESWCC